MKTLLEKSQDKSVKVLQINRKYNGSKQLISADTNGTQAKPPTPRKATIDHEKHIKYRTSSVLKSTGTEI